MPVLFPSSKKRGLALPPLASLAPGGSRVEGFTLIEATLATFILSVGVLGVFGVIQMIISFTSGISSRLQAIYLAQEGIENVRNIRDSNWLGQRDNPALPWDQGIFTGDWETIDKFQRKITISKPQPDKILVSSQITWIERGGTSEAAVETELYDWR